MYALIWYINHVHSSNPVEGWINDSRTRFKSKKLNRLPLKKYRIYIKLVKTNQLEVVSLTVFLHYAEVLPPNLVKIYQH